MTEHDPAKAQLKLEQATMLAHAAKMPSVLPVEKEVFSDGGSEVRARLGITDGGIDLEVNTDLDNDGEQNKRAYSEVNIRGTQGSYWAEISTSDDKSSGSAEVGRNGKRVHVFKGENADKAAALITSLAAKRLGERATLHSDRLIEEVSAAREAYHSD